MNAKRKEELLGLVSKAILQKKESLKEKVAASQEIAQAGMGSHSINSERHVAETVSEMAKRLVEDLENLKLEIENTPLESATTVTSPCWLEVSFREPIERIDQFFFLSTPVILNGAKVISQSSPLGQALLNKYPGNLISYEIAGVKHKAVVTRIE